MKLSVSLPPDDLEFLDAYASTHGGSRSSALHEAVQRLRRDDLSAAYDEAYAEWEGTEDARLWELTVGDGIK